MAFGFRPLTGFEAACTGVDFAANFLLETGFITFAGFEAACTGVDFAANFLLETGLVTFAGTFALRAFTGSTFGVFLTLRTGAFTATRLAGFFNLATGEVADFFALAFTILK